MKDIHEKANTDVVWSCVMEISVHYGCQARRESLGQSGGLRPYKKPRR